MEIVATDSEKLEEAVQKQSKQAPSIEPEQEHEPRQDPRFVRPAPSPFKRAALIALILVLFWLALSMRKSLWQAKKKPSIIYAHRYSKEHKFRPAASPVITQTLRDGRLKIYGATPAHTRDPVPTPETKKARSSRLKSKQAKKSKKPVSNA